MSGVVAAVVLSPQVAGIDAGLPGSVALLHEDGRVEHVETSGMDSGLVAFADGALYFSDTEFDYVLRETLEAVPAAKPEVQQALYVMPGSGAVVGLYNEGFTEDGYVEVVSTLDVATQRSVATDVEGAYWVTSQCGDAVFGIAPRSGAYLTGTDRERWESGDGLVGDMFNQIYPGEAERMIATAEPAETVQPMGSAPCDDGVVRYPSFNVLGGSVGENTAVLRSWSTTTGDLTQTPITFSDATTAELTADDLLFARMVPGLIDGRLMWMLHDGRILATDPTSAVTDVVLTLPAAGPGSNIIVKQTADTLWVMVEPTSDAPDLVITAVDVPSRGVSEYLRVDGFGRSLSLDLIVRDFVVVE